MRRIYKNNAEILNEIIEAFYNEEWPEYFQDAVDSIFKEEGITAAYRAIAEPVKRGHWIWEKVVLAYTCSLCHHFTYDGQPNYCPNCGARMGQEE